MSTTRAGRRDDHVSDKAPGPNGPKSDSDDPPEEERDDRHLDHDQRSGARERAVLRPDHARPAAERRQRRHDPGRVRQAAGRRHADPQLRADDVRRRRPASPTARRPSPTSAASPANVDLTVTQPRQGQALDYSNIVGARQPSINEGRRRPVERHADPGDSRRRSTRSRHHRRRPRRRLPAAVAASASRRSRASATTRSRTSTCRRSTTAASRTRAIGVVSNGYVVIGGGDGADIVFTPQTFPNPARPNNVLAPLWTRPQPGRRRRDPRSAR